MSKQLKFLFSLSAALIVSAPVSHAQNGGYTPPPMFDDMTPPMVRPETNTGNIVEKLESPSADLPPVPSKRPVITPRVSVDPNSSRQPMPTPSTAPTPAPATPPAVNAPMPAVPAPTVTTTPVPQQPVVQPTAPTAPAKMQPIIDPRDVKKSAAPTKPKVEKPKVSKPVAPPPIPAKKPVIEPPTVSAPENVPAPAPTIDAPQVPATPAPPEDVKSEEKKADTPPQPSPIAPEPEAEPIVTPAPKMEPAPRDPKESAIKGPKTMPALPTQEIDQQQTFEAKEQPKEEPTILERHQQESEQKKEEELKPVVPAPKADVAPASFDTNKQGALKKTIPFQQGQIGLSSAEIDPIAVAVVKELDGEGKEGWRVQIRAYATPYGTGVSSDKRIALSRALSLRSALIEQGVPAARIDVLAEGLQSENASQPDRIDLYMYGPAID